MYLRLIQGVTLMSLLAACSHPLEIVGEGDIVSSDGLHDCSLAEQPCDNYVIDEYNVTYSAQPHAGSTFVRWDNCDSQYPDCAIHVPAATVYNYWGETAPPLRAIFTQNNYGLTATPYTALQQVWAPKEPSQAVRDSILNQTFTVYDFDQYASNGLGAELKAGIPWVEQTELAPNFPGEGELRRSLAYIWVVADPQLIDEESPIRLDRYANDYRPHGPLTPHVFEAHVRTARRISDLSSRPFDFTVIAGDLTDTSQKNELQWLIQTLNGGIVDPDSGIDDDPVPGPNNDYNDPFVSIGIQSPWYAALGNHDVLHIGGFGPIDEALRAGAVGDHLYKGSVLSNIFAGSVAGDTVDRQLILSPEVYIPADANRLPLYQAEVIQTLHDAPGEPVGHGFTQSDVDNNRGYYSTFPDPAKPIKMIVLDTTDANNATIGIAHLGSMDSVQFAWLQEELAAAATQKELVIVVSHHRLGDFHDQSEVPAANVKALLSSSENVILHLTGHGHGNRKALKTVSGSNGYWELMTASTVDFPLQSRAVELVDEGNGHLSIYVTNFDHNSQDNTLASEARQLAAGRKVFGTNGTYRDIAAVWAVDSQAQNLLLRVELPTDLSQNLQNYTWPTTVESVETLNNF
ncbi:3',5'-cyclic adenosine monophosphate phosphodiesterase CpdA [Halioglobus japonicus]|nr:3',5'-cyclic adenosine monophosphate phosphodiesterase CpdA [Halioglobus japonicus]